MKQNIYRVIFGIALVMMGLWTLSGCGNQTVELAPESITIDGETLRQRLDKKIDSDQRLQEVQKAAERLNRVYALYQTLIGRQDHSYSYIDFLVDVSRELETSIPNGIEGKTVRHGRIHIPTFEPNSECRYLETRVETEDIDSDRIQDYMTFSFKGCNTGNQYLPVVIADWSQNNGLTLNFVDENLSKIFSKDLLESLADQGGCTFQNYEGNILKYMTCEKMAVASGTTRIVFDRLVYDNDGEMRVEAQGKIYANNALQSDFYVTAPRRGIPNVDIRTASQSGNDFSSSAESVSEVEQ